jgi:predicted secreted protein
VQRSRRIILAAHCLLNQNSVIPGEARSTGVMKTAVDWIDGQGWGILQLPCPEFTFLGPDRPSMTRAQYDTPAYREHSRRILEPFVAQLAMYQAHGYEIVGGFGIQGSPSCDPGRGVFMEELLAAAQAAGVAFDSFWQIPETASGKFDPADPAGTYKRHP